MDGDLGKTPAEGNTKKKGEGDYSQEAHSEFDRDAELQGF